MSDTHETVVVGGGFGGLFVAVELARRGQDVVLVDASRTAGGVASTIVENGYVLEPAAGTFLLPHRALSPILGSANVAVEEVDPAAGARYVWTRGRLAAIPSSPKAVLTPAISVGGKLRMAAEPFIRSKPEEAEESLREFMARRFGKEAGTLLSHVAASGVYAGDPGSMSAAAAFPAITALEGDAGSVVRGGIRRLRSLPRPRPPRPTSHVPVGGMAAAAGALATSLGERYRPEFPVTSVTRESDHFRIEGPATLRAQSVVLALRPADAAAILWNVETDVLNGWPSSPVVVVGVGGTTEQVPLPSGFGYLAGPDVDAVSLGCLFESSYAPGRAATGHSLAKVIAGGATNPGLVDRSDGDIVESVTSDMERALDVTIAPSWVKVVRHRVGIPHYDLDHRRRVAAVTDLETAHRGLVFAGWAYRGVGVSHLAIDAVAIANRLIDR